jgi:DNA-binding CsgD family transcriptional regulator
VLASRRDPADAVIGRTDELDEIVDFFADTTETNVLAIEGPAGIGKTTLFDVGVAIARDFGITVLSARPVAAETAFAFSGLSDLLDPIPDEVIHALPPPQHRALAGATLKEPPPSAGIDERALGTAVRTAIGHMAHMNPVLIAVDDVQWLDSSSSRILAYALRRLGAHRVCCMVTIRSAEAHSDTFDRAAPARSRRMVRLGPLSLNELHALIERRCCYSVSRPLLSRIDRLCAGNPLHALEIADTLQRQPNGNLTHDLPLPASIIDSITVRIEHLPLDARAALLDAALLAQPTGDLVDGEALVAAERAGMVTIGLDRIRFAHPMVAAAACQMASPDLRRARHAALAATVPDAEESTRHRALAQCGPDAEIAARLDDAVASAARRGAIGAATELADLAVLLTPTGDHEHWAERRLVAARCRFDSGDLHGARELLEQMPDAPGSARSRALCSQLLGQIHAHLADLDAAMAWAHQALLEAGDDAALCASIHLDLAFCSTNLGDLEVAASHCRAAVEAAERDPDVSWLADALSTQTIIDFLSGIGFDERRLERAIRAPETSTRQSDTIVTRPQLAKALLQLWTGDLAGARAGLSAAHRDAVERGEEPSVPILMLYRVWAEFWAGELDEAARLADEATAMSDLLGDALADGFAHSAQALAHATTGRSEIAVPQADIALERFAALRFSLGTIWPCWAKGLAALGSGDLDTVDSTLGPLAAMVVTTKVDPVLAMYLPDEIEALVGLGRLDEARTLIDWFTDSARRLDRGWALAAGARCRAVLCAATGDLEAAARESNDAMQLHSRVGFAFDRARTLLIAGQVRRRQMKRAAARNALEEAHNEFERMGATVWAARAQREMGRLGIRAAGLDTLTSTETAIANFAAEGLSNRQIADRAFLSVKAVEANLTRVYRKLGIRSRAGIARRLGIPSDAEPDGT